jgi:hypothetical protein
MCPAMADVVAILGAGASLATAVPAIDGFLDAAFRLRHSQADAISSHEFDLAFDLILRRPPRLHAKSRVDLDNIENVFSLVEMGRMIQRLPDTRSAEVEMVARSFRRLVVETVERLCLFPVARAGHWKPDPGYGWSARETNIA